MMHNFNRPCSVCCDDRNIYVTIRDRGCIYQFTTTGEFVGKKSFGDHEILRGVTVSGNKIYLVNQTACAIWVLDRNLEIIHHYPLKEYKPLLDSIDVDPQGIIYCSDYKNHCIYQIDKFQQIKVFGKSCLHSPRGIKIKDNALYVSDRDNDQIVLIDITNDTERFFLSYGRGKGTIRKPTDIEVIGEKIFVCDQDNYLIQIFDHQFRFISQIGGKGTKAGKFDMANSFCRFGRFLLISNRGCDRVDKLNIDTGEVSEFIVPVKKEGIFRRPSGVCINNEQEVFVADRHNHRIQVFDRKKQFAYEILGNKNDEFNQPTAVEFDQNGNLVIVDRENHRLMICRRHILSELQMTFRLRSPRDVAVDHNNNIYIADTGNNRIVCKPEDGSYERTIMDQINSKSIHITEDNRLIVSDFENNRFLSYQNGRFWDYCPQIMNTNEFKKIRGILQKENFIFIVDRDGDAIFKFHKNGELIKKVGGRGSEEGKFRHPADIKSCDNVLYVVDRDNDRIVFFDMNLNHKGCLGDDRCVKGL